MFLLERQHIALISRQCGRKIPPPGCTTRCQSHIHSIGFLRPSSGSSPRSRCEQLWRGLLFFTPSPKFFFESLLIFQVETLRRTPQNMFMTQLDLVVDTFFFISGVLATYFLCRMVSKNSVNPFQALLVRLARSVSLNAPFCQHFQTVCCFRIAPTYYVIVWFQASAALRFGSGPVWNLIVGKESENCANYWWANVLFVNNYLPAEKIVIFFFF